MADFLIKSKVFDVMQTTYSFPIGGRYKDAAIKKLHDAGIGVIAMKVVVGLTGLNLKGFDNPPASKGEGPAGGNQVGSEQPCDRDHRSVHAENVRSGDEYPRYVGTIYSCR